MAQRVYITGIGIITALGNNTEENLSSLMEERSGIGEITLIDTIHKGKFPLAEVKLTHEELLDQVGLPHKSNLTRTALLGMIAAQAAMHSAGIDNAKDSRTGLISATTVGGMDRSELFYEKFLADKSKGQLRDIVNHDCGDSTERIAEFTGIREFITTISTACSSASNAILLGARMIRNGKLDRVVAGGTESLTRFHLNGFNALKILDSDPCKPFDQNRKGINLGEGAAYLVIESEDSVRSSGKKIYAELIGWGNSCEAFHQTASSPDGTGAFLAMEKALEMSGLTPGEIDYINAHGTGTDNNDIAEGRAIERLFGQHLPRISSTKPFTGHTTSAAGSTEAILSILCIQHQLIWPNLNFSEQMHDLNFSPVTKLMRDVRVNAVMTNSFGFGGNDTSLIFKKYE